MRAAGSNVTRLERSRAGSGASMIKSCSTAPVKTSRSDRASASGIYLASYFFGGLVGSAVLGQIFDRIGWAACVAGIGVSLVAAIFLAGSLRTSLAPAYAARLAVTR